MITSIAIVLYAGGAIGTLAALASDNDFSKPPQEAFTHAITTTALWPVFFVYIIMAFAFDQ